LRRFYFGAQNFILRSSSQRFFAYTKITPILLVVYIWITKHQNLPVGIFATKTSQKALFIVII
jgi:hypothetical protein